MPFLVHTSDLPSIVLPFCHFLQKENNDRYKKKVISTQHCNNASILSSRIADY